MSGIGRTIYKGVFYEKSIATGVLCKLKESLAFAGCGTIYFYE